MLNRWKLQLPSKSIVTVELFPAGFDDKTEDFQISMQTKQILLFPSSDIDIHISRDNDCNTLKSRERKRSSFCQIEKKTERYWERKRFRQKEKEKHVRHLSTQKYIHI